MLPFCLFGDKRLAFGKLGTLNIFEKRLIYNSDLLFCFDKYFTAKQSLRFTNMLVGNWAFLVKFLREKAFLRRNLNCHVLEMESLDQIFLRKTEQKFFGP